jgi:hypothetical protein
VQGQAVINYGAESEHTPHSAMYLVSVPARPSKLFPLFRHVASNMGVVLMRAGRLAAACERQRVCMRA